MEAPNVPIPQIPRRAARPAERRRRQTRKHVELARSCECGTDWQVEMQGTLLALQRGWDRESAEGSDVRGDAVFEDFPSGRVEVDGAG